MPGKRGPLRQRFDQKYKVVASGCWEWTAFCNARHGYGQIRLGDGRMGHAHRVSWELHNGPAGDFYVLHRCDNRRCVNPEHLFLGTFDDNMADMVTKGRQAKGSRHGRAKLTEAQAGQIRALDGSAPHRKIGEMFGVSRQTIGRIMRGEGWLRLDGSN